MGQFTEQKQAKIFVAGHRGLVGSAIVRALQASGYTNLLLRTSKELDLRDGCATQKFMHSERPDYVFLAAAKVGGIWANNTYPAEFIYDNLTIAANVIHASYLAEVKKLLFLGSSCIYPKLCPQPMKEEYLLSGLLEPTNEPYAIAKIAGIKLCQAYNRQYGTKYISVMPTNLYGPGDNFDLKTSHVLPALIRKFHAAKKNGEQAVEIWGTGTPLREFLHVDDLASACLFLMDRYQEDKHVNIGSGAELTIAELANLISRVVGFRGRIIFNPAMPDGTPRKLLDISKLLSLGWQPRISLEEGVAATYLWFKSHMEK